MACWVPFHRKEVS